MGEVSVELHVHMLYVFYGNNEREVRVRAHEQAAALCDGGAPYEVITSDNASPELIDDAIGATSLFRTHEVFVLDMISDDATLFEALLARAAPLEQSRNHFVVIERTLLAAAKKQLCARAVVCEEYVQESQKYNAFALADALASRNKKQLWILLQEAWREGRKDEEIVGTLFWQLKMLRLAETARSPEEAGQKPFVFSKAQRALMHFKRGEPAQLADELLQIYHEGHSGSRTLSVALEAWVLAL